MDWLWNAMSARIGWALGETILFAMIAAIVLIVVALLSLPRMWRQARCKHLRFYETGACDAICRDCGKNLGFIGAWRDKIAAPR